MQPDAGGGDPADAAPRRETPAAPAPLLPSRPSERALIDQRRTRARELARLLPLLGVVLFFVPLLGSNARTTGPTGLWLFASWAALILVAALLSPGLKRDLDPESETRRDGK